MLSNDNDILKAAEDWRKQGRDVALWSRLGARRHARSARTS
jgi:hypothetical protein